MDFLKDFGVNPLLLAAQVVNFLVLLFILKKLLYAPLLKVLNERKKTIEQSLKNAAEIELQLQKTKEKSEEIIQETLKEAQKIMDQTKEAAALMLADTNKTAEQMLLRAQEDGKKIVELQKQVLMDQMKESAGHLVLVAFEKIMGKSVREEQKKLIEKEVKNLS